MQIGALRHWVTLENPGPSAPDGLGGYTQTWVLLQPSSVKAAIEPAAASIFGRSRGFERAVANTVESMASQVITLWFHPQVSTATRVTKGARNPDGTLAEGAREFQVTGVQTDATQTEMILVCIERVA